MNMSLVDDAKGFLNTPFNRQLVIGLLILGAILAFYDHSTVATPPFNGNDYELTIHYFYLPTCPHCFEQSKFNARLVNEFPNVRFVSHDASNPAEAQLLIEMAEDAGLDTRGLGVPATFVGKKAFIGYESEETTGQKIREAIIDCVENCVGGPMERESEPIAAVTELDLPFLGKTDLTKYSLPVLAVMLGLVDGFNPCAMWVLVYLIGIVLELNDRKKIWFIVGTFLLASGILYFLFMTAWLNAFLLMGYVRVVTILIGLIALGGGILSIKEYLESKGILECKVVGDEDKKRTMESAKSLVNAPLTIATVAGIIVLAFVVNSVEFVCSAAIPAVFTQVLALSNLGFWEYYGYIGLYVIAFMFDDMIVFGLAAFAVTGGLGDKYAKYCKIIGGIIMLGLGIMLLFFPGLLAGI